MSTEDPTLEAAKLLRQAIFDEDYEKVIELADKNEALPCRDAILQQARLRLQQYGRLLGTPYHAYACYKLEQYNKVIEASSDDPLLKAQAYYHLDRFDKATELYQSMPEDTDTLTNMLAIQADTAYPTNLFLNPVPQHLIDKLEQTHDQDDYEDLLHNLLLVYRDASLATKADPQIREFYQSFYTKSTLSHVDKDLTVAQHNAILYNKALAHYNHKEFKQAREILKKVSNTDWWKARTTVLLAYIDNENDKLQTLIQELQKQAPSPERDDSLAYLLLHQAARTHNTDTKALLESLPQSIREKPATRALLKRLDDQDSDDADYCMSQGDYMKAAALYEKDSSLEGRARRVQALSYVDPEQAVKLWASLSKEIESGRDEEPSLEDDEDLESKPLPRLFGSKASVSTFTPTESSKRSKESILRRRAKKREAYVSKLPDASKQTDPERWIPKHDRSNARRRRGQQHRGAQGGANAREAQKLDIVARKEARARGEVDTASTAHLVANIGGMRKGGRRR